MLSLSAAARPSAAGYGRWYDWGVLFFLFIIPFFPMPKTPLGLLAPVSVVLLTGWWFVLSFAKHRELKMDEHLFILISCFAVLVLLDLVNGVQFGALLEFNYAFGRITSLLVILLILTYLQANGNKAVGVVTQVVLFSAFVISVMIILEGFKVISYGFYSEEGRHLFGIQMPFRKATGVPLSDGKLGTLLIPAFTMLVVPGLTQHFLKPLWRWLFLSVIGFAIIIMQSRSGWLGLFMGLGFLSIYYVVKSRYMAFYLLGMTLGVAVLFFSPLGELILGGFVGEGVQARTVDGRLLGAEQALDASGVSFVLGQGHGNVFIENEIGKTHIIHNLFLDQLTSNGIVGMLVLLFVYGFFLWLIAGSLWKNPTRSSSTRSLSEAEGKRLSVILWLVTCWLSVFVEQNLYRGFYNEYISIYMALALYTASRFVPERKRRSII